MKSSWLALLSGTAGLALGWGAARLDPGSPGTAPASAVRPTPGSRPVTASPWPAGTDARATEPVDAETAVAAIATEPAGAARRGALRTQLRAWLARSPAAVLAWLRSQPPGTLRTEAWAVVIVELGRADPAGAVRLAQAELQGDYATRALTEVYRDWARRDGAAALADLAAAGGPRNAALRAAMVGEWAAVDPAAALDWVGAHAAGATSRELVLEIVRGMSLAEPALAADCVRLLPAGEVQRGAATMLAARWAVDDLAAARAWVATVPDAALRESVERTILPTWIDQDPAGVAAQADALPLTDENLSALARRWVEVDPAAAVAWAATRSADQRETVVATLAAHRAMDAPDEAARLVETLAPGPVRESASVAVAAQWAGRDPAAAAAWVAGLADPGTRRRAALELMPIWASTAPAAARAWARSLPDPSLRIALAATPGIGPGL